MLGQKTKVPGRKINEGTAQLLQRRIARMWPQNRKLANAGILAGINKSGGKRGGIKSVNYSDTATMKM
jgi:hypothetical protein